MAECNYCGGELEKTGGKMFVRSSGERLYFCSSKCQKNWADDRNLQYADT
jgi:large subunit ribosomal protein L24e